MRSEAAMVLRKQIPAFLGLMAVACGATSSVPQSAEDASSPASAAPLTESTEASPPKTLDLRTFRGALARDGLEAVRQAVEEDRPEDAAALLDEWLKTARLTPGETLRYQFVLGLQWREAGDLERAAAALEVAGADSWILADDARLLLAEIQLEQDKPDAVLLTIERARGLSQTARLLGLRAAALHALGRYGEAALVWQQLFEIAPTARTQVAWAASLLEAAREQKQVPQDAYRRARLAAVGVSEKSDVSRRAKDIERQARQLGAEPEAKLSRELELAHLRGLVDARFFDEASEFIDEIEVPKPIVFDAFRCEFDYLRAKLLAGKREWGQGADRLLAPTTRCTDDPELHARILFNAGKYAAADGRHTTAVRHYADLEKLYPENSLADDARLRAARSYKRIGSTARFVELLMALPEDYPSGDMTMEGVLELALYRMERRDWAGASQVLERGVRVVREGRVPRGSDAARGHEESGRERYFLARCREKLDEGPRALDDYEAIVAELPLSYYMLHAYSRLRDVDEARADAALKRGLATAENEPFAFPYQVEFETAGFERGMALLGVGETARGRATLRELGLSEGTDAALLWGMALVHDRAGDVQVAHRIARGRLFEWFAHYPAGDWQLPWQLAFPRPYLKTVQRESKGTGVPEWFIYGVMREESTFDAKVVSHANAYGLMQLIPPTARAIGKRANLPYTTAALKRPSVNIALGSRVLQELERRFRENPWLAIPGYNAGPGRPARWLRERPDMDFDVWVELIPYRETRRYTKRVLASRAAYAFLYYRDESPEALLLPEKLASK